MRLSCGREGMAIFPENTIEEVYLEKVLGLLREGDICIAKRVDDSSLGCWKYIEVCRKEEA